MSLSCSVPANMTYRWRRRSSSFGSYGSYKSQSFHEEPSILPELIEGYAHLCFPEDGSWFRGSLVSADGTSYNLSGKQIPVQVVEEKESTPDIIKDFPSPISTPVRHSLDRDMLRNGSQGSSHTELESHEPVNQIPTEQAVERDLQFALDEFTVSKGPGGPCSPTYSNRSPTESRPGSPPSAHQILKALDNLRLQDSGCFSSEEKEANGQSSPSIDSKNCYSTPFRSRSSSRTLTESVPVAFSVTVSDLEEGTAHTIPRVSGRSGNSCTLRCRQLCFVTEKAFWGQRADMVIQKQLAAAELVGQGCHVFAGPMRLYYNQLVPMSSSLVNTWCW